MSAASIRLYDPLFSTAAISELLTPRAFVQYMLQFEAALAQSLEEHSLAPTGSSIAIASISVDALDIEAIAQAAHNAGNLCIPFVKALTEAVAYTNPQAAGFVHLGATSQDVLDTATILQARDALTLIERDLAQTCNHLAALIRTHRHDLLAGRTWLQQGPPVTLGLKLATTLDALLRHRTRVAETRQRCLVLQFGGAAGTLAAYGDHGTAIATSLGKHLQLAVPDAPWHTQRDRIAELGTTLALLTGTLGKFARDLSLLMQTEVDELSEPISAGRGGSSTMPHKRNPVSCAIMLSAAHRLPQLAATLLSAMPQEHERGLGGWHAEWETFTDILRLTAGALDAAKFATSAPIANPTAMQRNLGILRGASMAEAVASTLAPHLGKAQAHHLLEQATQKALTGGKPLRETLLAEPTITDILSADDLDRLLDPANYLGSAQTFIDNVLQQYTEQAHAND